MASSERPDGSLDELDRPQVLRKLSFDNEKIHRWSAVAEKGFPSTHFVMMNMKQDIDFGVARINVGICFTEGMHGTRPCSGRGVQFQRGSIDRTRVYNYHVEVRLVDPLAKINPVSIDGITERVKKLWKTVLLLSGYILYIYIEYSTCNDSEFTKGFTTSLPCAFVGKWHSNSKQRLDIPIYLNFKNNVCQIMTWITKLSNGWNLLWV